MSAKSRLIVILLIPITFIGCQDSIKNQLRGKWSSISIKERNVEVVNSYFYENFVFIDPAYNRYTDLNIVYVPLKFKNDNSSYLQNGSWEYKDELKIEKTTQGIFDGTFEVSIRNDTLILKNETFDIKCIKTSFLNSKNNIDTSLFNIFED